MPDRRHRARLEIGHVGLILGVVALALGGSGLAIALTHAGPPGATGATGATGAQGEQGAQGSPGTPATSLWASVASTGAILGEKGVTFADEFAKGQYDVVFDQSVQNCAYLVTPNYTSNSSYGAHAFTASPNATSVETVVVATYNYVGEVGPAPFYLAVFC